MDYARYLWAEVLYSIMAVIYLLQLNQLNKRLLAKGFEDAFRLMGYENYKPAKFFVFALVLFGIGIYLVFKKGTSILYERLSFSEIISALVAIVVIIIFLVLILIFINNPILRAVLTICAAVIGFAYVATN